MSDHDARKTTDHDEIKRWVEERGGKPAAVKSTESGGDPGLLRIMFEDNEDLDPIPWDAFFEAFEDNELAFLHQDKTKDGATSRFFKLVSRD